MNRFYATSRRAWTPRFWPVALLGTAIVVPAAVFVFHGPLGVIESAAFGAAVAVVLAKGRWMLWKHRHPQITVDEYLADLRRNAHLN